MTASQVNAELLRNLAIIAGALQFEDTMTTNNTTK